MSSKHPSRRSSINWTELFGKAACRLIEFGAPDSDGLVIQRAETEAALNTLCLLDLPVNDYNISHEEIAGTAHTMFMTDGIYVSITPWPGSRGDLMRHALNIGAVDILPVGTGCVGENDYVWNYRLLYIHLKLKNYEHTDRHPI